MAVDKIDFALLKQEIVDWHGAASEGCELMIEHADKPMDFPELNQSIQFETKAEQRAFRLGVIIAQSQFSALPFSCESDDEESENE